MQALTLWARSLRTIGNVRAGLDLQAVWFDKDSVIAPDGSLFFTDLEGLDWVPAWPPHAPEWSPPARGRSFARVLPRLAL